MPDPTPVEFTPITSQAEPTPVDFTPARAPVAVAFQKATAIGPREPTLIDKGLAYVRDLADSFGGRVAAAQQPPAVTERGAYFNPKTGAYTQAVPYGEGIPETPAVGVQHMVTGGKGVAGELAQGRVFTPKMYKSAREMVDGLFEAATPFIAGGLVAAPAATAVGLAEAAVTGYLGTKAASYVVENEDAQALIGDLTMLLAGGLTYEAFRRRAEGKAKKILDDVPAAKPTEDGKYIELPNGEKVEIAALERGLDMEPTAPRVQAEAPPAKTADDYLAEALKRRREREAPNVTETAPGPVATGNLSERVEPPPAGVQPEGRGRVERPPLLEKESDPELVGRLIEHARERGYTGDEETLRGWLGDRLELTRELDRELEAAGRAPQSLLKAVAEQGGLSLRQESELTGELKRLKEFQDNVLGTTLRPQGAFGIVQGVKGVFREKGLSVDDMLTRLRQDPRFEHIENVRDFLDELEAAARTMKPADVQRRFEESLGPDWWKQADRVPMPEEEVPFRPEDFEEPPAPEFPTEADLASGNRVGGAELEQLVNVIASGEQGAFRVNRETGKLERLPEEAPKADVLDTGEQQPRLPGAEGVREQEIKTPEFEAPFSLEGEATTTKPVEPGLFDKPQEFAGPRPKTATPPGQGKIPFAGEKQLRPSEIVRLLSQHLNELPVRVGRFKQRALGIYKPGAQVVRLKVANDLQVLAHEAGHYLDDAVVKRIRNKQINPELEKLGAPTSRPSYTPGQRRKEGVAEFVRIYLSDPDRLKTEAPNYLAAFEKGLEQHPEINAALQALRSQYRGHLALTPKDRVLSHIDFKGADTSPTGKDWVKRLEQLWVDNLAPIRYAEQAMTQGKPVDVLQSGKDLADLARGAAGKADGFLEFGVPGTKAPSFQAAIEPVRKDMRDFVAYVTSKRVLELTGKRGLQTGIDYADAAATVKQLETPVFKKAAEDLYKFQAAVLEYAEQGGYLTASQRQRILKLNQFYVPFRRMQEALDGVLSGGGPAKRLANRGNPIKRYKGSGADIINPLESVVRTTHAIVDAVEKNRSVERLDAMMQKTPGGGRILEEVEPPTEVTKFNLGQVAPKIKQALEDAGVNVEWLQSSTGRPTLEVEGVPVELDDLVTLYMPAHYVKGQKGLITFVRNGERQFRQVNDLALYDAITAIGTKQEDLILNFMQRAVRTLRAGATTTLGFLGRNPVRDAWTATVNSRYGFTPDYTVRGLFEYLKRGEMYQAYLDSGAANAALVSMDRDRIRIALRKYGVDQREGLRKLTVLNPMNALQALSEGLETATRLGEFMKGVKAEGNTPEGRARAALAARSVTIDFARGGDYSKMINRYTAFFNASVQGKARIAEVFSGRDTLGQPGRTRSRRAASATARAVTAITIPTMALWYLNHDNPEYEEIPAWEKMAYWHVPLGKGKGFARIPTPFDLFTVFGASAHAALDYMAEKDPKVAGQLFPDKESAWNVLSAIVPTALLPAIEVYTNYDTYRDRPIVSPWELNKETELQANRWTSDFAKDVGPLIGLAPAKLDHLIYGYFAGLGRDAIGAIDLVRGKGRGRGDIRDVPLFGSLPAAFSRPLAGSDAQSIQDLYRERDRLTGLSSSASDYAARGQRDKADQARASIRDSGFTPARLNAAAERLGDLRKQIDRVWASTTMTPEQKQKEQNLLYERMVNVARRALGKDPLPSRYQ